MIPVTDNFHFQLMQLFNGHNQVLQKEARTLGLSPGQPKILECLDSKQALSPKQIGKMCIIDKATMTSLLEKMEKDGLVIRFANPADKRSVLISLTDKGMGLAKQINSSYSNIDETVLSCLSTEEKDQFLGWIRLVASKYIED
ncbi:DNA-binding transcriptional regulator, MarR family [Atopobium minutum]|uniref:DNA-binding transcriptional regulator, MarR family n=1 Tax=Atopobium minutum TaxID=1381 RepID=A0AB38A4B9_9ACTN|nr:DNA-binding transcriptional regulator, MarR family [Atopobium minutum]